jgi:hypothetical protein
MGFFLEITNIWQKSGGSWFADFFRFLKTTQAGIDFPMDFVLL